MISTRKPLGIDPYDHVFGANRPKGEECFNTVEGLASSDFLKISEDTLSTEPFIASIDRTNEIDYYLKNQIGTSEKIVNKLNLSNNEDITKLMEDDKL